MKGNFHVRFLGEGVAAMPLPYPTLGKTGGFTGLGVALASFILWQRLVAK